MEQNVNFFGTENGDFDGTEEAVVTDVLDGVNLSARCITHSPSVLPAAIHRLACGLGHLEL